MKTRLPPLWLLRDMRAFLSVMLSFWPMVILRIAMGGAARSGRTISEARYNKLGLLFTFADAMLDWALRREAYRRIGWSPRDLRPVFIPIDDARAALRGRIPGYLHTFEHM